METIAVLGLSPGTNRLSDPRPPGVSGDTSFADYLSKFELQESQSAYRSQTRGNRPSGPSGGSPKNGLSGTSGTGAPRSNEPHSQAPRSDAEPAVDRRYSKTERVTDGKPEKKDAKKPLDNTDTELSVVAKEAERSEATPRKSANLISLGENQKGSVKDLRTHEDGSYVSKRAEAVRVDDEHTLPRGKERASRVDLRGGAADTDEAATRVGVKGAGKGGSDTGPEDVGDHAAAGATKEAPVQGADEALQAAPDEHNAAALSGNDSQGVKRGSAKDAATSASVSSTIETTTGKGTSKSSRGRRGVEGKNNRVASAERSAKAPSPASIDAQRDAKRVHHIEVHLDVEENASQRRDDVHLAGDAGTNERPENEVSTFLSRMENVPATPTQRFAGVQNATQALARRLNGDLGSSIVRQAKIMLKESGTAEIRLIIRPPELGRVRINMQMENGHIAGRILVDNGNVREVLEQNLAALERAFEEAGLEVGDFEVSTGDPRGEAASDGDTHRKTGRGPARKGAGSFAESVEPVVVNDYSHRTINLVA